MSDLRRLLVGIVLLLGVVVLAMQVVPSVPTVRHLIETRSWLSGSDVTQIVFLTASLALMLALSRGRGSLYGLRWVPWPEIGRAVRASLLVALIVAAFGVASALASVRAGADSSSVTAFGWGLPKLIVSVWIVASISEEMLFRGLVQGFLAPLRARGFTVRSVRLSLPVTIAAVAFALGHLGLLGMMPPPAVAFVLVTATILGIIAGRYRERTGSVVPAIAVHMTFNVVGVGLPILVLSLLPATPGG